jgi:hypothetical protein
VAVGAVVAVVVVVGILLLCQRRIRRVWYLRCTARGQKLAAAQQRRAKRLERRRALEAAAGIADGDDGLGDGADGRTGRGKQSRSRKASISVLSSSAGAGRSAILSSASALSVLSADSQGESVDGDRRRRDKEVEMQPARGRATSQSSVGSHGSQGSGGESDGYDTEEEDEGEGSGGSEGEWETDEEGSDYTDEEDAAGDEELLRELEGDGEDRVPSAVHIPRTGSFLSTAIRAASRSAARSTQQSGATHATTDSKKSASTDGPMVPRRSFLGLMRAPSVLFTSAIHRLHADAARSPANSTGSSASATAPVAAPSVEEAAEGAARAKKTKDILVATSSAFSSSAVSKMKSSVSRRVLNIHPTGPTSGPLFQAAGAPPAPLPLPAKPNEEPAADPGTTASSFTAAASAGTPSPTPEPRRHVRVQRMVSDSVPGEPEAPKRGLFNSARMLLEAVGIVSSAAEGDEVSASSDVLRRASTRDGSSALSPPTQIRRLSSRRPVLTDGAPATDMAAAGETEVSVQSPWAIELTGVAVTEEAEQPAALRKDSEAWESDETDTEQPEHSQISVASGDVSSDQTVLPKLSALGSHREPVPSAIPMPNSLGTTQSVLFNAPTMRVPNVTVAMLAPDRSSTVILNPAISTRAAKEMTSSRTSTRGVFGFTKTRRKLPDRANSSWAPEASESVQSPVSSLPDATLPASTEGIDSNDTIVDNPVLQATDDV